MLTDMACRKAAAGKKPYKIYDAHGLFLYVTPTGSKHWRYKYRYDGKERLLTLGSYPLVSLQDARSKHDDARRLLLDGIDPAAARKEGREKAMRAGAITFELVAREWHEAYRCRDRRCSWCN